MAKTPGAAFSFPFCVFSTTGALVNADSLPTGTVVRNGVDDGTPTVTITNVSTGRYKASGTIPNTYTPLDDVDIIVNYAVSSVVTAGIKSYGALDADLGVIFKVANSPAPTSTGFRIVTLAGGPAPAFANYFIDGSTPQEICWIGAAVNAGKKTAILVQNASGDVTCNELPNVPVGGELMVVV